MRRAATALILVLASATAASAQDTDKPHRPWGKVAVLGMSFNDARACIAREFDKRGSVLVLPVEGGVDIDWTIGGAPFAPNMGEPLMTFQLRTGAEVTLSALYRHPLQAKTIDGTLRSLTKRCLVVREIRAQ